MKKKKALNITCNTFCVQYLFLKNPTNDGNAWTQVSPTGRLSCLCSLRTDRNSYDLFEHSYIKNIYLGALMLFVCTMSGLTVTEGNVGVGECVQMCMMDGQLVLLFFPMDGIILVDDILL